jgi:tetratricopeptide (TPR) repeat protein
MRLYYPSKVLSFLYLILLLFFLSNPSLFANQDDLTEMQKQARIYRIQGWDLQDQGRAEEAISCYQKAILLDPSYVVAYNDLGIAFEREGWTERAKQMYLEAIKIAPDYPNSYTNLALLYEEQRDYSNAALYWTRRAFLGEATDPWKEAAMKRFEDITRAYPEFYNKIQIQAPIKNVTLFEEETKPEDQKQDNKSRALSYLSRAKESFSQGQYVTALKYATIAEYIDSSNSEISSFVEQVRKTLLQ